jgi:adenylate kinase
MFSDTVNLTLPPCCPRTPDLYSDSIASGYAPNKIEENVQAEIMQVVIDEARESYEEDIILELSSCAVEEVERNALTICERLVQMSRK